MQAFSDTDNMIFACYEDELRIKRVGPDTWRNYRATRDTVPPMDNRARAVSRRRHPPRHARLHRQHGRPRAVNRPASLANSPRRLPQSGGQVQADRRTRMEARVSVFRPSRGVTRDQGNHARSHRETSKGNPGRPPTTSIAVPSAVARALRISAGRTNTSVPVGASSSSPSTVKMACPLITANYSSWPSVRLASSSTSSCGARARCGLRGRIARHAFGAPTGWDRRVVRLWLHFDADRPAAGIGRR